MEGPKRLPFTTLGPPSEEETKKPVAPTLRFELALSESTDTTCPEFFYSELMKTAPGADQNKSSASDDPFGDDDADKLAAIAKAFEAKYNKPDEGKKKKKKKWKDDYLMDLGDGYDESDTFIDNSEAYDEVLPEQYTTKLGGFYINSGRLDLKEVSDDSEDDFLSPQSIKGNRKKRRIESDDDSEEEKKQVKKKLKDGLPVDGEMKKKKKKKLALPEGEKPFKKPKLPQEKEKTKQNKSSNMAALIKSTSPNMNGDKEEVNGLMSQESSSDSNDGDAKVQSNISMVIDSVIARVTKEDSNSQGEFPEKKEVDPESIPKMPGNLPPGIEEKIVELKQHAKQSREGKCKFFTATVNKLLLGVEMASKQMTVSNRSCMYGHLAAFLPCSKETLLKRAKTLRVKEMEDKIKEPLEKLQQAVSRVMPALLEKYEADCQKVAQDKQGENSKDPEKDPAEKEDGGSDSDEEEKTGQEATKKRQLCPRKKFVWDNNLRGLLCDVVRVKMHSYQMAKTRSQTAEEYCKAFLETDVRPIWPKGWMQTRMLYKESKSAHALWTNPQKKKTMMISKTPNQSTAVSKTQTVNSAPPTLAMPKVSVTTKGDNPLGPATISPPGTNASKPNGSSNAGTPVGANVKRLTPTILYSSASSLSGGSNTHIASHSSLMQQAKTSGMPDVSSLTPTQLGKVLEARVAGGGTGGQKQTEQSWDHMVSDILRSSFGEQPTITKSAKAAPSPSQKSSGAESSSFMAHYEKFALSQAGGHSTSSQSSSGTPHSGLGGQPKKSPPVVTTSQKQVPLNLSSSPQQQQQQRILQQQQQLVKQQQQHQHQQLVKQQLVKQQSEDKLKQLQEQQKMLQMKLQKQTAARQLAEMTAKAKNQMVVSPPQGKQSLPSPMSLAMSKPLPMGQSGGAAAKKLSTQFNQQAAKSVSYRTENIIHQQLGSSSSNTSHSLSNTQAKIAQQNSMKSLPYVTTSKVSSDHLYGQRLSSSSEGQLRKTSPKSQVSPSGNRHSPSVNVQNAQSLSPGTSGGFNTSPASNGKPAVSLLKSLFGQVQSQATAQQQHALLQASAKANVSLSTSSPQWSQGTMKSSPPVHPSYTGSGDSQGKKQYPMSGTSPRQLPGYQGLTVTNEQLAAYQAAQKRLSPDANLFGKGSHVMQRPVQAPHSSLLPSDLHYNTLYGYHGYEDKTK